MKVTIEISDAVLEEAKDFGLREGTTADALAEDAMRQILNGQREGAALAPEEAPVQNDVSCQASRAIELDAAHGSRFSFRQCVPS